MELAEIISKLTEKQNLNYSVRIQWNINITYQSTDGQYVLFAAGIFIHKISFTQILKEKGARSLQKTKSTVQKMSTDADTRALLAWWNRQDSPHPVRGEVEFHV